MGEVTPFERDELARNEEVIERGIRTFIEVGGALLTIREGRLYRAEHATFEDYCRERWGLSRSRAYRMIEAAQVVSPMGDTEVPVTNERQARELARVPEPERAEVWRETVERTNGRPTAAAIRQTYQPPEPPAGEAPATSTAGAGEGLPSGATPEPEGSVPPLPDGRDRADAAVATIDDSIPWDLRLGDELPDEVRHRDDPVPREPIPWTGEENELHQRLIDGETIVVSMRDGRHARLIAWADERGLFVRIDRRSPWGNPFEIGPDGDRDTVIGNYNAYYLPHKPSLLDKVNDLRGKALGCWCAPEPCHGDVLKARSER